MVRRRLSLKETTSTFMLNLQNHRQCPAGGFLLWEVGGRLARPQDSLKAGSGIRGSGRRRGLERRFRKSKARHRGSPAGRRSPVRQAPNQVPVQPLSAQGLCPEATDRVTATPQCLRKRSAFGNLMAALFICCAAGTYFVHLSFRVKSAFAQKS